MTTTFTARALTAITIGLTSSIPVASVANAVSQRACLVTPTATTCYASETALYQDHPELGPGQPAAASLAVSAGAVAVASTCSTATKLYSGTSYAGTAYVFSTRLTWINLPAGIDLDTSSFKIGACSVVLKDGLNGGGITYPGSTAANTQATSMSSGWDNRPRSIKLN